MDTSSKLQLFHRVQQKYPDDLQQLEMLEPTPTATLGPKERLARACRLGQIHQERTGQSYKPYSNVANTIRYFLVNDEVPGEETLLPCEELMAQAERCPQDFKKVFARHDNEAAENRKQVVKEELEGRRDDLKSLLSPPFLKKLKNQITQKTSATRGIVKERAIKARHDFLAKKYFAELMESRGAEPVHFAEAGSSAGGNSLAATPLTTVAETPDFSAIATPSTSILTPAGDWMTPGELPDLVLPAAIRGLDEQVGELLYDFVAAACGEELRHIEARLGLGLLRKNSRIMAICRESGPGLECVQHAICDWVVDVKPDLDNVSMSELESSIVKELNSSQRTVADLYQCNKAEVDKIVTSQFEATQKQVKERCEVAKSLLKSSSVCAELDLRLVSEMKLMKERIHCQVLERWNRTLLKDHFFYMFL